MNTTMERRYGKKRPPVIASYRLLGGWPTIGTTELEQPPFGKPQWVWLSKTKRLERHTLRGVPGNALSLLLPSIHPADVGNPPSGCVWVWRVHKKEGRYDGKERIEIAVTHWNAAACRDWQEAYLNVDAGPDVVTLVAATEDGQHLWQQDFRRLRTDLVGYDIRSIFEYQRHNYYAILRYTETEELAKAFVATINDEWTLNAANRLASRMLYGFARDNGWRKLTMTEQQRYGVSGQWHRQEELDRIKGERAATDGHRSTVGEYSQDAASGCVPIYGRTALLAMAEDYADRHGLPKEVRQHLNHVGFALWLRSQGQHEYADAVEGKHT